MKSLCGSGKSRWSLLLGAALLLTASAQAQAPAADSAPAATTPGPRHGRGFGPGGGPFGERMELLGFGGMRGGKVVTGAPFTANASAESKRTLADGTVITQTAQSNLFRDGQGRFRKEVTLQGIGASENGGAPHSFVMIQDPVAGAGYMLQPDKKVAHKLPQHRKGGPNADSTTGPRHGNGNGATNPNFTKVSLGTQTVNGVSAQGTRFTRTIPAGQMGNDKPLTITKEEWYSPDLQMMVQIKHSDPFLGDTTYNVSNIQRTAPSPSVFSVPSDYTIKEGPAHGGPGAKWRGRGQQTPPAPDAASPSSN